MDKFRFRHQPFRSLYQFCHTVGLLLRFPAWVVQGSIPPLRPRPSWGISKVLYNNFMLWVIESLFQVGMPALESSRSKVSAAAGFADVEPIPSTFVVGEIAEMALINHVEPARIWGYWHDSKTKTPSSVEIASDEKVILFFHAGGFVMGSAAPDALFTPTLCSALSKHGRVFALEYRLASTHPFQSTNPFPTALLDALSGYQYLLTKGANPSNIILCGESAGCVLVLSLARYLIMNAFPTMPPPGGVLMFSPSTDWGLVEHTGSLKNNASSDYSMAFYNGYSTRAAVGALPITHAATSPWISPGSHVLGKGLGLFKGFPKTCIIAGEGECMLDGIHILRDRILEDVEKKTLTYVEIYGATHCFCSMPVFEPERTEGLGAAGAWISTL